ncbi:hypothetical protein JB92DRAFT_3124140 [Gautieria morchelliformis]|nr:hypothetical protein JB92DRAFT_3124140 [Gautieria morchelliformis]
MSTHKIGTLQRAQEQDAAMERRLQYLKGLTHGERRLLQDVEPYTQEQGWHVLSDGMGDDGDEVQLDDPEWENIDTSHAGGEYEAFHELSMQMNQITGSNVVATTRRYNQEGSSQIGLKALKTTPEWCGPSDESSRHWKMSLSAILDPAMPWYNLTDVVTAKPSNHNAMSYAQDVLDIHVRSEMRPSVTRSLGFQASRGSLAPPLISDKGKLPLEIQVTEAQRRLAEDYI